MSAAARAFEYGLSHAFVIASAAAFSTSLGWANRRCGHPPPTPAPVPAGRRAWRLPARTRRAAAGVCPGKPPARRSYRQRQCVARRAGAAIAPPRSCAHRRPAIPLPAVAAAPHWGWRATGPAGDRPRRWPPVRPGRLRPAPARYPRSSCSRCRHSARDCGACSRTAGRTRPPPQSPPASMRPDARAAVPAGPVRRSPACPTGAASPAPAPRWAGPSAGPSADRGGRGAGTPSRRPARWRCTAQE